MKSILKSLMSVAVAALAFTSCSNDATEDVMPNGGLKTLEVNATIDQTRTTLTDHTKLTWATDDQIHIYIGADATEANVIDYTIGGEKITGVNYKDGDKVYAYYSAAVQGQSSDGVKKVLLSIPATQIQTEADAFAGVNMPMVAKGTIQGGKVSLAFQPLGHLLVFNVYGPAENEKIKSIKFTTSVPCGGYNLDKKSDLTAEQVQYNPFSNTKSVTVKLPQDAYAPIVAAKPDVTQSGSGNQVYMVVAQANYPAGAKFIVTTDAGTYTFTTKNALDCSMNARVVNLNLANAEGFTREIVVPTNVPEHSSEAKNYSIAGIEFRHFTKEQIATATVSVYSDAELQNPIVDNPWLTFGESVSAELSASGTLHYNLAANTETTPRTAYIGIKCGDVTSPAIAITQVGAGSEPAKTVTYVPENMGYGNGDAVEDLTLDGSPVHLAFAKDQSTSNPPKYYDKGTALRCYAKNTITVTSSSTAKITKIVITSGLNDKNTGPYSSNNKLLANGGTLSEDTLTWTGDSNNVVLTVDGESGHIRIGSMEITYSEGGDQPGGGEQPDPVQPDPDPTTPPAPGTILFEEDFNSLTGTDEWTDYAPEFSDGTKIFPENGAIRLGASGSKGSITTKELNLLAPTTLEFKVKGWTNVEGSINILVDGKKVQNIEYKATKDKEFEQKSVQLEAATGTSTITIATTAKRAIIDDIVVKVTE